MTSALQILVFSSVKWASNTHQIMLSRGGFCPIHHPIIVNSWYWEVLRGRQGRRNTVPVLRGWRGRGAARFPGRGQGDLKQPPQTSLLRVAAAEGETPRLGCQRAWGGARSTSSSWTRSQGHTRSSVTSTSPGASELRQLGWTLRELQGCPALVHMLPIPGQCRGRSR